MELYEMRLGEPRSSNPLRISHPKIDKLACQAKGADIFAVGEISLQDANCNMFNLYATECIIIMELYEMRLGELRSSNPLRISHPKIARVPLDANCTYIAFFKAYVLYHIFSKKSRGIFKINRFFGKFFD